MGSGRQCLTVLVTTVAAAAALTACGSGRSVEAYCEVISDHIDEFTSSMDGAMASSDPFTGLGSAFEAASGLAEIWEKSADAAPSEIQEQVELVRDTWNGELFDDADSDNLFSGIAEGFAAVEASFEAHQAVEAYTSQNCPAVTEQLNAEPAGTAPEPAASDHSTHDAEIPAESAADNADLAAEDEATEEPEDLDLSVLYQDPFDWSVFGPYLVNQGSPGTRTVSVNGSATIVLPGREPVTISASDLLPQDEVLDAQYTYGTDDDGEPVLIAVVQIRTPASGLTPEGEHHEVVVIDTTGAPELVSRAELADEVPGAGLLSTSGTGQIAVAHHPDESDAGGVYGIDAATGEITWSEEGVTLGEFAHYANVLPAPDDDYYWEDCGGINTARNIVTGEAALTVDLSDTDLRCPGHFDDRFWLFREFQEIENEDTWDYEAIYTHHIYDIESQGHVEITTHTWDVDSLNKDPVRPLARTNGYTTDYGEGSQDLAVFDITTGNEVYALGAEQAEALNVDVSGFYDGKLYVTTSDEQLVIDVDAGDDIGTWEVYPVGQWSTVEGDYTWMSDGSLHLDWEYDPDNVLSTYEGNDW